MERYMLYKELDPAVAWAAIEGQGNLFTAAQEKADAFYRQFVCPSCKGASLSKRFNARHAFADPGWMVGRATLLCAECQCHFDPHSGLILEMGNPANVQPDIPIIGR